MRLTIAKQAVATLGIALIVLTTIAGCGPSNRGLYLHSDRAPDLGWPQMAHCIHNAATSTPGDQHMKCSERRTLTESAGTLCAIALAGQRPKELPDTNCYQDELNAYLAKYHLEDREHSWNTEQQYAILACTPITTTGP